jgi:alanine racemase
MTVSRRTFVSAAAATVFAKPAWGLPLPAPPIVSESRFDPWLEIDSAALIENVRVLSELVGGRPIMAVVKNNAYGLGLANVAGTLEPLPQIAGFAVVKTAAALALRDAGVRKPILLMGLFSDEDGPELVTRDIHFSLCTKDAAQRLSRATAAAGRPAGAHIYLDTGMSRMGVPYHEALPWLIEVSRLADVHIYGTFMGFTEDAEYDREQLRRFETVAAEARAGGANLGQLHAASSNAVFNFPDSYLDMVRPGISLYGAYPSNEGTEREVAELRCAFSLRARVVRVQRLRPGDSVSYGRNYVAEKPTWIATLPVGHADGFTRRAVDGARVLINGRTYPVIGAVSASHAIVELGAEPSVEIGDVATLVGPDDPAIHPNALATATGTSVYDVLMHLSSELPKRTAPQP